MTPNGSEVPRTIAEIRETLERISDEWRSGTADEQKRR